MCLQRKEEKEKVQKPERKEEKRKRICRFNDMKMNHTF